MGIAFVLTTGAPWRMVPEELGCGSGVTCWRRLQEWTELGVWPQVHLRVLTVLGNSARINWNRQCFGARRFWGGAHTGPNPTDRGKNGCKRHVITDAAGVPLLVSVMPANVNDDVPAITLLDRLPRLSNVWGRPRNKPIFVQGDRAYGTKANIAQTEARGIFSELAPRSSQSHGSGLGRTRYVVERTLSWFGNYRRLKLCYEKCGEHFQAFHDLAAILICVKKLRHTLRGF